MAIRKFLSATLALLVVGCASPPKTHQPGRLQFESASQPDWAAPFYLQSSLDGSRQVLIGARYAERGRMQTSISNDGGQTFSASKQSAALFDGEMHSGRIQLLFAGSRMAMVGDVDREVSRLDSFISSDGESWEKGGSLATHPLPRVSTFARGDAGNTTMALVGPSENLDFPLYLSVNEGGDWELKTVTLPSPEGYSKITVKPPGIWDGPEMVVDRRDRIHWLVPEYRFSDSAGKALKGSLYLQVDGQGQTSHAQVELADYNTRSAALGENTSLPEHLYRVTCSEAVSKENSRISIPYRLEFSQSQDGGVSWAAPCALDEHNGIKQFAQVAGDGKLIVVAWRDDRSSEPGLYCCSTLDGGGHWSEAQRVGDTPAGFCLLVHQGKVLLAGWCEGRSSFEPGPVFSIRGKARN